MTTSHPIFKMSPPLPGERVPNVTFSYFNSRNRRRAFDFLVREFVKSGITKSELAVRTGKSKAQISRLFGRPANLTTDTIGELLFAISGKQLELSGADPFKRGVRQPEHPTTVNVSPETLMVRQGTVIQIDANRGPRVEGIQAIAA